MSFFSRSKHGISNYTKFFGCDFTVFTEGKKLSQTKVNDIYYYEELLKIASNGKKPKIICVGNKFTALEYAKKITTENLKNSIVVVDKDLEGITSSSLVLDSVIRTYGYSWENEFWTTETITEIIESITNKKGLSKTISADISKIKKQLRYISCLDAALQVSGSNLLPKDKSLCGVNVTFPKITTKEIKRLSNKYKLSAAFSCNVSRGILSESLKKTPEEVIQGHFWSNVSLKYISNYFKNATAETAPTHFLLTNIAFSNFSSNPSKFIQSKIITKYQQELIRLSII